MNVLRAFISGIFIPSIIVPFFMLAAFSVGRKDLLSIPFFHVVPLLWALWNAFDVCKLHERLPGNDSVRLLLSGGIFGFLLALFGVYVIGLPKMLGVPDALPLIAVPILYALFWRYLVGPLNRVVGI